MDSVFKTAYIMPYFSEEVGRDSSYLQDNIYFYAYLYLQHRAHVISSLTLGIKTGELFSFIKRLFWDVICHE